MSKIEIGEYEHLLRRLCSYYKIEPYFIQLKDICLDKFPEIFFKQNNFYLTFVRIIKFHEKNKIKSFFLKLFGKAKDIVIIFEPTLEHIDLAKSLDQFNIISIKCQYGMCDSYSNKEEASKDFLKEISNSKYKFSYIYDAKLKCDLKNDSERISDLYHREGRFQSHKRIHNLSVPRNSDSSISFESIDELKIKLDLVGY